MFEVALEGDFLISKMIPKDSVHGCSSWSSRENKGISGGHISKFIYFIDRIKMLV